jgi:hypothetical protein
LPSQRVGPVNTVDCTARAKYGSGCFGSTFVKRIRKSRPEDRGELGFLGHQDAFSVHRTDRQLKSEDRNTNADSAAFAPLYLKRDSEPIGNQL